MTVYHIPDGLAEKALQCKTSEELIELAKSYGYNITNDDLEFLKNDLDWGCPDYIDKCPKDRDNW